MNVEQEESQLAHARRVAHANGQRVVELESELLQVRPVAQTLHEYVSFVLAANKTSHETVHRAEALYQAMFAVHEATTPSQSPATHVVVAVDELEALRAIADAAGAAAFTAFDPAACGALRDALDETGGEL